MEQHMNPIELYYHNQICQIENKLVTELTQFIIDLNNQEPGLVKIIAMFVWLFSKSLRLSIYLTMPKCKLDKRPQKCLQLLSPREWACYLDIRFHTNYLENLATVFIDKFVEGIASKKILYLKITEIIKKVATDIGFPAPKIFAEYISFQITNHIFSGREWYIKEVNGDLYDSVNQKWHSSRSDFLKKVHFYVFEWLQIFQEVLKIDIINMKNNHQKQKRRLRGKFHSIYRKVCDRTIKICMYAVDYEIIRNSNI